MSTSGSYNFSVNRNDILTESMEIIGELAAGETLGGNEATTAARTLNMMIKGWQALDYGLWLNKEIVLFLQADTIAYDIGPTGDECTLSSGAVKTELAADAASAASSITLDSVSGMSDNFDRDGVCAAQTATGAGSLTLNGALVSSSIAYMTSPRKILIYAAGNNSAKTFSVTGTDENGASQTEDITGPNATTVYSTYAYSTITAITIDAASTGNVEVGQVGDRIGIEIDDDTIHWTYISNTLSTTTTLVTALDGAASTDNHVYVYTTKTQRPLDIIEARRRDADNLDIPLEIIGRDDYMMLSDKTTEGTPTSVFYDPQTTNGKLYVWPEPDNMQDRIYMSVKYPIQDFDASTDDADFPQEWFAATCWNLAVRLCPKFGRQVTSEVAAMAISTLEAAVGFDREHVPIKIKRNMRRFRRM